MRQIRSIPQRPVKRQRLAQSINDEDRPEDGDGLLPVSQRVWERRRLRRDRGGGSFFHECGDRLAVVYLGVVVADEKMGEERKGQMANFMA